MSTTMSLYGGRGPLLVAVIWTEIMVCLLFVAVRTYSRDRVAGRLGWDDVMLWIAWGFLVVCGALSTVAATKGYGLHLKYLTEAQFVEANMWQTLSQSFCAISIAASKAAVAGFLLRIVVAKWQRKLLWSIIGIVTLSFTFVGVANVLHCKPIDAAWNPYIEDPKCWAPISLVAGVGFIVSVTCDFVLAALPWYIVSKLQMHAHEKRIIATSLSLGVIAGIFGIVRTISFSHINVHDDYAYRAVIPLIWTYTELSLTITCVCIPALRPLWRRFTGSVLTSSGYGTRTASSVHLRNMTNRTNVTTAARQATVDDDLTSHPRMGHFSGMHSRVFSDSGINAKNAAMVTNTDDLDDSSDAMSTQSKEKILGDAGFMGIRETREVTLSYEARRPTELPMSPANGRHSPADQV